MKYAIYHSADLDGITCGALAKIAHPDIHLIGYDYGQPLDEIEAIPDGSEVYMMDISLPKQDMLSLGRIHNLTWIDHHKSAMKEIMETEADQMLNHRLHVNGKFGDPLYLRPAHDDKSIRCYCEVGRAACELAMEFFNLDGEVHDMAVKHLGMYDTWRKHEDWNTTLRFQFGMRALVGLDVDKIVKFLTFQTSESFFDVVNLGKHIIEYQREQARIIMQNSFECTLAVSGSDYNEEEFECIAVNAMGLNTDMLPPETDLTGKILLQFILRKDDLWHISMRSEGDLDVGAICTKLGGGGHKNAAGCILTLNEKMERFWEFGSTNDDKPGFLVIDHTIED